MQNLNAGSIKIKIQLLNACRDLLYAPSIEFSMRRIAQFIESNLYALGKDPKMFTGKHITVFDTKGNFLRRNPLIAIAVPQTTRYTQIDLCPTLKNEFKALQETELALKKESGIIDHYLRLLLNLCSTTGDIFVLAPKCLHIILEECIKESELNTIINPPMIDNIQIKEFRNKFTKAEQLIEQRILTNLLYD